MGVRTGKPRGRPKGARNKSSVDFEKALVEKAKQVEEIVDGAFSGDAHVYLMSIYKDPEMAIDKRIDAAKAALPYEKPKLQSVMHTGDADKPVVTENHFVVEFVGDDGESSDT